MTPIYLWKQGDVLARLHARPGATWFEVRWLVVPANRARGQRTWRERLGPHRRAPDLEEWVPVTSAAVDNAETGFSSLASRSVEALKAAGIETQQKPFVVPDQPAIYSSGPSATDRIRVAVLVRYRDLEGAREQLRGVVPESEPHR